VYKVKGKKTGLLKERPRTPSRKKPITGQIKAKIAIEALKGIKTVDEIAHDFDVLPAQVIHWRNILQKQASKLFEIDHNPRPKVSDIKRLNTERR
jgi:transposase-like protein